MIRDHTPDDPFAIFETWLADAVKSEVNDPTAMTLACVGADGMPSARMVLMKGFDRQGFVFYTNYESRKGQQLLAHPMAALLFHWKSLRRQVRIEGQVSQVTPEEADAYFATRPRQSQLGALASRQSEPLPSRMTLLRAYAREKWRHAGSAVPRPGHWSGFRVEPRRIEFWHARPWRLHERTEFVRADGSWSRQALFP